jgi:1-deoxy-D-xylulose-5-phosphate reductoisomerase
LESWWKQMKKIALLGCSGSIGDSTSQVLRDQPGRFDLVALAANKSLDKLWQLAEEFDVKYLCLSDPEANEKLKTKASGSGREVLDCVEDLIEIDGLQMVVGAIVGAAGMEANHKAVSRGIDLALANKETLIMAGEVVMKAAKENGAKVLPVDSEHSAIWQCLWNARDEEIESLILTASGGPFYGKSAEELKSVTLKEALNHPTWDMGPKITIDSATLMNKGLEVIEARHLFGVETSQIEVLVHRQSLLHSMVQFRDGSMLAQLGMADMKVPIQVALDYPYRHANKYPRLDLAAYKTLTFEKPDLEAFPCLRLAFEATERGGTAEAVLNAANEISVELFLEGQIAFHEIPVLNEEALNSHPFEAVPDIEALKKVDSWARDHVFSLHKA